MPTPHRARWRHNRLGEPNFRVVWGGSRLTWIGGRWTDRDAARQRRPRSNRAAPGPEIRATDRWHIERWTPPESYGSPEQWYRQTLELKTAQRIPALGPYPSRGEYEHCFTLESAARRIDPAHARGMRLDHSRSRMVAPPSAPGPPPSHRRPRIPPRPPNSTPPPTPSSPKPESSVIPSGVPRFFLSRVFRGRGTSSRDLLLRLCFRRGTACCARRTCLARCVPSAEPFFGIVILSEVARAFVFPASFRGRATQPKDLSSIYTSRNRTSKRGSSTPCPGASRKSKIAGHSAQNDARSSPSPPKGTPLDHRNIHKRRVTSRILCRPTGATFASKPKPKGDTAITATIASISDQDWYISRTHGVYHIPARAQSPRNQDTPPDEPVTRSQKPFALLLITSRGDAIDLGDSRRLPSRFPTREIAEGSSPGFARPRRIVRPADEPASRRRRDSPPGHRDAATAYYHPPHRAEGDTLLGARSLLSASFRFASAAPR